MITHVKALIVSALVMGTLYAAQDSEKNATVLNRFEKHLTENDAVPKDRKDAALKVLKSDGATGAKLLRALSVAHPKLGIAQKLINDEKADDARTVLKSLQKSSDPWLSANATFLLGRLEVFEKRYPEAQAALAPILKEKKPLTCHAAETLYLTGICEAKERKYAEASATFKVFLDGYPDAPQRLRKRAAHFTKELTKIQADPLYESEDLMDWSGRKLDRSELGTPTQAGQEKIINNLDLIIKKLEEQQQQQQQQQQQAQGQGQGQGQSQGQGEGEGPPTGNTPAGTGATSSQLPGGQGSMGTLTRQNRGRAGETWGNMPSREREKILSSLKSKYPNRYKELVEQYFKNLQQEE